MNKDDGSIFDWWIVSDQENPLINSIRSGGSTPEEAIQDYMETLDKVKMFREEFDKSMKQSTNAWKTPVIGPELNDLFNASVTQSLQLSGLYQAMAGVSTYNGR